MFENQTWLDDMLKEAEESIDESIQEINKISQCFQENNTNGSKMPTEVLRCTVWVFVFCILTALLSSYSDLDIRISLCVLAVSLLLCLLCGLSQASSQKYYLKIQKAIKELDQLKNHMQAEKANLYKRRAVFLQGKSNGWNLPLKPTTSVYVPLVKNTDLLATLSGPKASRLAGLLKPLMAVTGFAWIFAAKMSLHPFLLSLTHSSAVYTDWETIDIIAVACAAAAVLAVIVLRRKSAVTSKDIWISLVGIPVTAFILLFDSFRLFDNVSHVSITALFGGIILIGLGILFLILDFEFLGTVFCCGLIVVSMAFFPEIWTFSDVNIEVIWDSCGIFALLALGLGLFGFDRLRTVMVSSSIITCGYLLTVRILPDVILELIIPDLWIIVLGLAVILYLIKREAD